MLLVIAGWLLLIGGFQLYAWQQMISTLELFQQLIALCRSHPAGPAFFVLAAALSPLLLTPAALLGAIAGLCYGPIFGVIYTILGCNLSALLTYSLGRFSGSSTGRIEHLISRYGPRLRQNSFLSVIILRLSFLPYDPINYLIGLLRVPWPHFILANTLGSLPGVIMIVLAGTAVDGIEHGLPMLNPLFLAGAVILLLVSLGVALLLRRQVDRRYTPGEANDDR